jgi:hypothetical protein
MKPLLLGLVLSSLVACTINGNRYQRPRDLEDASFISKPRLLGVRSIPAEPRPGDTVALEALLVDPTDTIVNTLWIACPPTEDDDAPVGCTGDDQEVLALQPLTQPFLTVPTDLLDGLDEAERREGRNYLVQVTGLPEIDPATLGPDFDFDAIDFNEVEAGYKRVVVSEAPTPNANPVLGDFTADGTALPEGAVLEVDRGQQYAIGIFAEEASIETYTFLNSDGVEEQREEEPYVLWYADGGTVDEPATLHPFLQSTWTAPDEPGTHTIHAVMRDRRGGQDWRSLQVVVR